MAWHLLVHAYYYIRHLLGYDTQQSMSYDFMSGAGPFLLGLFSVAAIVATALGAYRRWTCRKTWWCWRHGDHALTDPDTGESRYYCWKHHPAVRHKHWRDHHIRDIWERSEQARKAAG